MKKFGVFLLCSITVASWATPLTETDKLTMFKSGVKGCLERQQRSTFSKDWKDSRLREYCDCTVGRMNDSLTQEDIARVASTNSREHIVPKANEASGYCATTLMKKARSNKAAQKKAAPAPREKCPTHLSSTSLADRRARPG